MECNVSSGIPHSYKFSIPYSNIYIDNHAYYLNKSNQKGIPNLTLYIKLQMNVICFSIFRIPSFQERDLRQNAKMKK